MQLLARTRTNIIEEFVVGFLKPNPNSISSSRRMTKEFERRSSNEQGAHATRTQSRICKSVERHTGSCNEMPQEQPPKWSLSSTARDRETKQALIERTCATEQSKLPQSHNVRPHSSAA